MNRLPNPAHKPEILAYRDSATARSRVARRPWFAIGALGLVASRLRHRSGYARWKRCPPGAWCATSRFHESRRCRGGASHLLAHERVLRSDTIGSLLARTRVGRAGDGSCRTDATARALYQLRLAARSTSRSTTMATCLRCASFRPAYDDDRAQRRHIYRAARIPEPDVKVEMRSGEIRSSLFATTSIGLPDRDARARGRCSAATSISTTLARGVLQSSTSPAASTASRRARGSSTEFENRGTTLRIFGWPLADGTLAYYTEDGRSARRAFLRSPMEFSRVTSVFRWRFHRSCGRGAPPRHHSRRRPERRRARPANSRVEFAGARVVRQRRRRAPRRPYSTLYARLSRFATGLKGPACDRSPG
jgi:hypothetical protein